MAQSKEYATRRQKLLQSVGTENAAILFAAQEPIRNGDVHFPFRQNSDFYYFTGFDEPDAVALFLPKRRDGEFILFNRPRDALMERWLGPVAGQEGACRQFGANQAFTMQQLEIKVLELIADRKKIYYPMGSSPADEKVMEWLKAIQSKSRKNSPYPSELADIREISAEMRLIKSSHEIDLMRNAAAISADAHRIVMQNTKPGMYEYELEARLNYELGKKGCRFSAYPAIVGGGSNACVLHYVDNKDTLKAGEVLLVDAGGEYKNYASDITRSFPVNGKFTQEQALVYRLVLAAQKAVIATIKPGVYWHSLQELAVQILTDGLISLGILSGDAKEAIKNKKYQDYYMHNIGHWIGLDVHDVGSYKTNDEGRQLEAGMILTVEPGLYLAKTPALNKRFWDIGVRIEDDVLVTNEGREVLSAGAPKEIEEIESLMASA